ncbi:MAG TPA: lytic transglycosylase domain-containing protein, partial [Polyangiaceae bacterium]|nr:lytic transglycosylase domain-containing protein [Polyangiaceae bacterium]
MRLPRLRPRPSRVAAGLVGALALAVAPPSHADIYKTVDEDGVISFTSQPKSRASVVVARSAPPAPRVAAPRDRSPDRVTRYDPYIRQAAILYQIPEDLIRAVIKVESDFDPRAVSPKDARGLMQLIPATAQRMLVTDAFDPRQNIFGGTRYLRVLANLFNGDLELTLAAYNAGEGAVIRYGGIPPYPETQDYVVRVIAHYRAYRALSSAAPRCPPPCWPASKWP